MFNNRVAAMALLLWMGAWARAFACDLCAIYIGVEQRESRIGPFAGIAEQYSDYETLQRGGTQVPNPAGERLHSFITQLVLGYSFTPRMALQVNLPVIARDFRRQEARGIVDGDESGIGDLSLVGTWTAYTHVTENTLTRFTLLAGLKLPSGNSRRIKEELGESHDMEDGIHGHALETGSVDGVVGAQSHAMGSGIHGHDLALGSGSVDGVIGTQLFWSWQRAFIMGAVQYALRSEGDFDYQYANDLIWAGGPGEFVFLTHRYTVGLQAELSGESKGTDTLAGVRQPDTAITALYIGPDIRFTWGTSLGANLAVDLPLLQHNSGLQAVPNFRLRGGLTWRF